MTETDQTRHSTLLGEGAKTASNAKMRAKISAKMKAMSAKTKAKMKAKTIAKMNAKMMTPDHGEPVGGLRVAAVGKENAMVTLQAFSFAPRLTASSSDCVCPAARL